MGLIQMVRLFAILICILYNSFFKNNKCNKRTFHYWPARMSPRSFILIFFLIYCTLPSAGLQ